MSQPRNMDDSASDGIKIEPIVNSVKPAKIISGKFRRSGMAPGAIEQYLMPPNRVRAESPDIEIIYDSTSDETPSMLPMRNPREIFSTPDKNSGSSETEFGRNLAREAPLHVMPEVTFKKNLGFKSDPEDDDVIIIGCSASSTSSVCLNPTSSPGNDELESCVLTPHSVNLPLVNENLPQSKTPSGSMESADETDEDVRVIHPGKRKIRITPAEKKRCVPVEEKENEKDIQACENLPPQKAMNIEGHSDVVETEKSTNPLVASSEKLLSSVPVGKKHDRQPERNISDDPDQDSSPSNLQLAWEQRRNLKSSDALEVCRNSPRLSVKQIEMCESPNKATPIGKLRPISVNVSKLGSNEAHDVSPETVGITSVGSLICSATNTMKRIETDHSSNRKRTHETTQRGHGEERFAANEIVVNKKRREIESTASGTKVYPEYEKRRKSNDSNNVKVSEVRADESASVARTVVGQTSSTAPCTENLGSKVTAVNCDIRLQKLYKSNAEYAALWEKKKHKEVLLKLSEDVQEGRIPSLDYTVEIVSTCILCLAGRIRKEVRSLANTLFHQLIQKVTVKKYFWSVFDCLNGGLKAQNNGVINLLLVLMKDELCNSKEKLALEFFKNLTVLCEQDYEKYQTQFKLRQPLFVQLMMDPSSAYAADYNTNWSNLLKHVDCFKPDTEEAQILMKWTDLLASHYMDAGVKQLIDDGLERLKENLVANIINRRDKDYGYKFLLLLKRGEFSLEVSRTLFCDYLPRLEHPIQDWTNILRELCAYLPVPPQPGESKRPETGSKLETFYNFVSEKVNMQGESNVHVVCKGKKCVYGSGGNRQEFDARKLLYLMKTNKVGNINITDNNGNTPLHEASYNGRADVIRIIWQLFTEDNKPPGPHRVDVLAQNEIGQTALHSAVEKGQSDCVALLITMSKDLVRIRTKAKETALDLLKHKTDPASEEIRKLLLDCPNNVRKYFGGVKFPEETIMLIESDKKLQTFLFYWRELYEEMHLRVSHLATC